MKIILHFKSPDAVYNALERVKEEDKELVQSVLDNWIRYNENLVVEIDTENGACVPIPVREN